MNKTILASVLGLAMTACATTGTKQINQQPYAPEQEVYALGLRIERGSDLPEDPAEYAQKIKLAYDESGAGDPDFITDVVTVNCDEINTIRWVRTGFSKRLQLDETKLSFLRQIDAFSKYNSQNLEARVAENFNIPPEFDLFDYSKARTITIYLTKGTFKETSNIGFKPDEYAVEIRYLTEDDNSAVRYYLKASDATKLQLKAQVAKELATESKKPQKLSPEAIQAGQSVISGMLNSYLAIVSQMREYGYCKASE